jgi:hypothetical protein
MLLLSFPDEPYLASSSPVQTRWHFPNEERPVDMFHEPLVYAATGSQESINHQVCLTEMSSRERRAVETDNDH